MNKINEAKQTEISEKLHEVFREGNGNSFSFIEIGEWLIGQGYFHIEAKLFGNALAGIVSKELGTSYKYQEKTITYKIPEFYGCQRFNEHNRFISILSPKEYGDYYKKWTSEYPFRKEDYFDTAFRKNPIELRKDEIVLYSGDLYYSKPESSFASPFPSNLQLVWFYYGNGSDHSFHLSDFLRFQDVKHHNEEYDFIQDFVVAIMSYKLQNRKPNLNEEDMEMILRDFGFKREEQIQKIIGVLGNVRDKAINVLAADNQVGMTLKKR